ncbi:hypothetical protein PMZ80_007788 [Knufia obscura]|uniref:Uncharacterized protein n=1 Tax=Knufia obscura TaxID=1635080 RepID=A0ABR0RJC4_9EURO|nr:hypothetical protein PMZ80_007788 [Knufia obscura]
MSGELSDQVIILIVVLGSAAVVACGYGMHRALATRQKNNGFERGFNERNVEQDQYMVDLRMAYRQGVMAEARSHKPGRAPVMASRYSQESSEYGVGHVQDNQKGQHAYQG